MFTFTVDDEQQRQINEWYQNTVKPKALEVNKQQLGDNDLYQDLTNNEQHPYYGAIGGGFEYKFTQTSLGVILVVEDKLTGEQLNVTDFESW